MVTILISAVFRGATLFRGEALISTWIPKCAALIRGRRLFETQPLLDEIRYAVDTYKDVKRKRGKDGNKNT